jgi:hypothetical protein
MPNATNVYQIKPTSNILRSIFIHSFFPSLILSFLFSFFLSFFLSFPTSNSFAACSFAPSLTFVVYVLPAQCWQILLSVRPLPVRRQQVALHTINLR